MKRKNFVCPPQKRIFCTTLPLLPSPPHLKKKNSCTQKNNKFYKRKNFFIILVVIIFQTKMISYSCGKKQFSKQRTSYTKSVLKICSKFTGEHPCRGTISINVSPHRAFFFFTVVFTIITDLLCFITLS